VTAAPPVGPVHSRAATAPTAAVYALLGLLPFTPCHHINMGDSGSVTITLDLFTVSLLLATLLFGFTFILAKRKYSFLNKHYANFDLKKLLVLSLGTAACLRMLSFLGVIAMDMGNVNAHYSLAPIHSSNADKHPIDINQSFYNSAMAVLFDLPNTIVVSTYALLILVWSECSLLSRFHTESQVRWRKKWLLWYTLFNCGLYTSQLLLYFLLFIGPRSKEVVVLRDITNVAMAVLNLISVSLVLALYFYLNTKLSGYPYRSRKSKQSLKKIATVMWCWTCTRIIWGISFLVIYVQDIDLLRPKAAGRSPLALFVLLVLCEVAPMIGLLDYSFMTIFDFERGASRELSSLATGQHDLSSEDPAKHLEMDPLPAAALELGEDETETPQHGLSEPLLHDRHS